MNIKETEVKNYRTWGKIKYYLSTAVLDFLVGIKDGDVFEVKNSGMCIYSYSDLEERNQTYQIKEMSLTILWLGKMEIWDTL